MAALSKGLIIVLLIGSLVLAACGGDSEDTSGTTDGTSGNGGTTSTATTSNNGASTSSNSSSSTSTNLTGDAKDIDTAMKGYFQAVLKEDSAAAYTYLDSASRGKCDQAKFATNVQALNATFHLFGTKEVKFSKTVNISVTGDTATAGAEILFDGSPAVSGPIKTTLHRENGKWGVEDVCQ
jgi:hypothetical protein